jgi:outer membrane protein OmpA-like peptidoglycan-associated protein
MANRSDNPSLLRKILDLAPSGAGDVSWSSLAGTAIDPNSPLMSTGKRMLSTIFGGSESALIRALGAGTGLQPGVTSSLMAMAAPMVMNFLGRRVRDGGISMGGLGNLLQREIPAIRNVVPAGVADLLWPREYETFTTSPVVAQAVTKESSPARWLLPLMLLALIPLIWLLTHAHAPVAPVPTISKGAANRIAPEVLQVPKPALPKTVDLYFETGSVKLRPGSYAKLKEFAAALPEAGNSHVMVRGYTDNIGSAASNMRLSQERANAVKADLVRTGISTDRVTAEGFGEENYVAENATAEGRATNRRVTVEVGDR